MPVGPVSTDPTLGSVVDASLSVVAETPDPVGAAFVVVGELCDEPHAAASTATAAIAPISPGYRSLDRLVTPEVCCMGACVGVFIAPEYRGGTSFVHRIHKFLGAAGVPGDPGGWLTSSFISPSAGWLESSGPCPLVENQGPVETCRRVAARIRRGTGHGYSRHLSSAG